MTLRLEAVLVAMQKAFKHPLQGGKRPPLPPPLPDPEPSNSSDAGGNDFEPPDFEPPVNRTPSPCPQPDPTPISLILPDPANGLVSAIERIGSLRSTIPQGEPSGKIAEYFMKPFNTSATDPDEIWEDLNTQLDVVIGRDTLDHQLTLGPFGLNGLLRSWYARSRQFNGWYDYLDKGINAKLAGIILHMEKRVIPDVPPPLPPPSTTVPTASSTVEPPALRIQDSNHPSPTNTVESPVTASSTHNK
jgi:hypothetical protein